MEANMYEMALNKNEFVRKKTGLIIARLNPEEYFKKEISGIRDYYYHLGLMHGQLLKDELQEMARFLPDFFIKTRGKTMGKTAYKVLFWAARQTKKYIRQDYLAEIEGVAKGAEVDSNFVLLINVFDELKNCQSNLWIIPTIFDLGGCSALAIESKRDQMSYGMITDYTVFGDILGRTNTVFIYQKKFGNNFVTVGWPGYVGLIRGMNDQGTVLLATASYSKDQTIKGVPTSFLFREVIELNKPSLIETAPRTIGNNVLIGNKEGTKVMEISAKQLGIRKPTRTKGKKYIIVTNHYKTRMERTQRDPVLPPGSTIPPDKIDKWFWGFFGRESNHGLKGSKGRTNILEEHIHITKDFSPENIKKILAKVANPYTTLNAMIFDPTNLELYIADNDGEMPATKGKLVKIDLKEALNVPLLTFVLDNSYINAIMN